MSSSARSHSRTPSHGTSLVRSHFHSASSAGSHAAASGSTAGSGDEGHEDSKSTSQDGSGTNDESAAGSDDEAPGDDEHKAGEGSNIANSSSDVKEAKRSGSEVEGSTSQGSQSSLESDDEMPVHAAIPWKETGKDTATKEAKTTAPSSSQLPPDADSKVTQAEQKCQWHKDAQHLDKHFGAWCDCMLSEGCAGWKECDEMHCEHGEPHKELQNQDPTSPPLNYMKQCRVFKAKKTNVYDLCHFYCMELSGDLPPFPSPCKPATCKMLEELLREAWALEHPNLLMAFTRDLAMVVCLLQELHHKDSLKCLPLEPKSDADGKTVKKLSFCPFCFYNGSNDISYMTHIMCRHYGAVYGCGKCLKEVFLLGQQLKMHLKVCVGFPKGDTPSSSDKEPAPQGTRKAPREASTAASTLRRKWTLPRSPANTPRFTSLTRSPSIRKRLHPRRRSRTRTRQTNPSPKRPAKSRPSPSMHLCSPSSWSNVHQKWHRQPPGTVVFSHSF